MTPINAAHDICDYCWKAVRYAELIEWSECLIKLMTALIEGINGKPVNMIRHIPFEVYADERITLNGPAFYDASGEGGSQERASPEGGLGRLGGGYERERLPPLLFYSSQMAVFSCMRLKDVSNSQHCVLGKLILQDQIVSVLAESESARKRV